MHMQLFRVLFIASMFFVMPVASFGQEKDTTANAEPVYEMKKYWMVFLKRGPNRSQDSVTAAQIQKDHLANIGRLAKMGKILVAGPFGDDGDMRGIFIMDCKDEQEAKDLCATDPAVIAGRLAVEIRPWWTAKMGSFK